MNLDVLSKYSELPYSIIGLYLTDNSILEELNDKQSVLIKRIFNNVKNCAKFIDEQTNNEKIILIISGQLPPDDLTNLKQYSQIEFIYLLLESNNDKRKLECIYTKPKETDYLEIFLTLFKKLWFLLGLVFALIFAFIYPSLGASDGPLYTEYTIKWEGVIIISFLNGLSIPTKTLAREFVRFRLHIFIQVFTLICIPFTVYGVCLLLIKTSLNKVLIAGILAAPSSTTAIASTIVMTKKAGGNTSATIINAVLGNILGVFVSPALLSFFMLNDDLNILHQSFNIYVYLRVLLVLCLTVLLPVSIGQIIRSAWSEKVQWAQETFHFSDINGVLLLILLWQILCDLFQSHVLKTVHDIDLIVIILLNAAFYITFSLLAMFLARLPNIFICRREKTNNDKQPLLPEYDEKQKSCIERWRFSREDTISIMLCATMKSIAKGLPLIDSMNTTSDEGLLSLYTLPLILYYVEQLTLSGIEVILLQKWLKSE